MADSGGKLICELKVHELRTELANRGLDGTGVKATLVARLEKVLSEQGVDINSFMFSTGMQEGSSVSASTLEKSEDKEAAKANVPVAEKDKDATENTDVATAAATDAATSSVAVEKKPEEDAEVIVIEDDEPNTSLTADDLVERVEDEIDQDELDGSNKEENECCVAEEKMDDAKTETQTAADPNIDDLEEKRDSEDDNATEPKQHVITENPPIHEISDEEDIDEMMVDEPVQTAQKDDATKPEEPTEETKSEGEATLQKHEPTDDKKNDGGAQKAPLGLKFPSDDPHGTRCIWIRGIPVDTRISDLKLAFMGAGFRTNATKIFTTKSNSSPSAFGFMTFGNEEIAKNAVSKMHNSIIKGKIITVERACDSSMLQTDLLPTERTRSHPPIKAPEKTKKKPTPASNASPPQRAKVSAPRIHAPETKTRPSTATRASYRNDRRSLITHPPPPSRTHYSDTVSRARVIRAEPYPSSRRIVSGGSSMRVLAPRSPPPSRGGRHPRVMLSPPPPPRHDVHRPRPSHHHEDRLLDEQKRLSEMLRRKEEEHRLREKELKMEAERQREKLERERLERENLELKLKLQERELRAAQRRSPPPPPLPPTRRYSPANRRALSPPRRLSPVRRASPQRHGSRANDRSGFRQEPPKEMYPTRRRSRSPLVRGNERMMPPRDDRRPPPYEGSRPREDYRSREPPREMAPKPYSSSSTSSRHEPLLPRRADNFEPGRSSDRSRQPTSSRPDVGYRGSDREPPRRPERPATDRSRRDYSGRGGDNFDRPPENYSSGRRGESSGTAQFSASSNSGTSYFNNSNYRDSGAAPYSTTTSRNAAPTPSSWNAQPQQPQYQSSSTNAWSQQTQPSNISSLASWNPFPNGVRNAPSSFPPHRGF